MNAKIKKVEETQYESNATKFFPHATILVRVPTETDEHAKDHRQSRKCHQHIDDNVLLNHPLSFSTDDFPKVFREYSTAMSIHRVNWMFLAFK